MSSDSSGLERLKQQYPDKFLPEETVFDRIRPGDRIFIGAACGEPQHLVHALTDYVKAHPKAFFDAEIIQVWTLGVAPYTDERLKSNFRYNSFFVGDNTRAAVNAGLADYTPIFLSQVPDLFHRRVIGVDVALIQTSLPDAHGYLNLGVSVDIVKAAVRSASLVIAQVNHEMPRIHGDGFLHVSEIDFLVAHDEPLLEYRHDGARTKSRGGSAATWRASSRTATRSRWATGACRTRFSRRSARRSISASTPSCSPTASWS